jgi:rhomboid protease GluP
MEPGREVETPTTEDSTPLPQRVDELTVPSAQSATPQSAPPSAQSTSETETREPALPTADTVLLAIAATEGAWFPARFAEATGVPRDSLDEPLAELRLAGLVRVAEWVRGVGQGYALTPEGKATATDPAALERLKRASRAAPEQPPKLAAGAAEGATGTEETDEEKDDTRETELVLNPPIVVPALLMANVLWFSVCAVWSIRWGLTPSRALSESHPEVLHRFGAVSGMDLLAGEWWRLLSSCFVHIGALHLIGNMFALAMMGPLAELLWGRGRLLLIYIISGLAGSALAMALRPDSLLAGASGAIWGIQMSLFAWLFTFRRHLPPELASDWFRRLSVVFVLSAGVSFLPNVSWEGHLGGGVAGFLTAGLLNAARFGDRSRRLTAWFLLILLPLLCVGGLVGAMDAKGMPGWQHLRQRIAREQEAREELERLRKLREAQAEFNKAQTEFNKEVAPRVAQLASEAVKPVEGEVGVLLALTKRSPERVAQARAKVEALKGVADTAVQFATRTPTSSEEFDRHRERARAFAAARAKSFELLLGLLALDAPVAPTAEPWRAWQAARAEADRLWTELVPKGK